jgi:hypothetical protein
VTPLLRIDPALRRDDLVESGIRDPLANQIGEVRTLAVPSGLIPRARGDVVGIFRAYRGLPADFRLSQPNSVLAGIHS